MFKLFIALFIFNLTSIFSQTKIEDFDSFQQSFFTDSVFQYQRIKYPLVALQKDPYAGKYDSLLLSATEWHYYEVPFLQNEYSVKEYDNFKMKKSNSKERVIEIYKKESDAFIVMYYFKLIKSKWYLVKYVDDSL